MKTLLRDREDLFKAFQTDIAPDGDKSMFLWFCSCHSGLIIKYFWDERRTSKYT